MLDRIVLRDQTRAAMADAILAALEDEFGPDAGINLGGSWSIERPTTEDQVVPVDAFGSITIAAGRDGEAFAAQLAARLHDFETIEAAREREAKLASLYEAAQDFAAELDLDRALDMIVERGRSLTGSDICYLSLNDDERGDTYVRTTAGTRSDAFRHIRLRLGDGLGGLVAKEGKPYYSPDYLHDERFVHVVDSEVGGEGMVSVMGVPLRRRERVIGVLFVGNRYRSAFGDEDVSFLQALADHAAIAIENARLYGRLDRAAALHRRLTGLLLTEQPIETLERAIGDAVGVGVQVRPSAEPAAIGTTQMPLHAGPLSLGSLVVDSAEVDEEQRMALEQASRVIAVHLLKERAVLQAELRTRGELLDALVAAALPVAETMRRAAAFGLDLARPHRVVAVRGDESAALSGIHPDAFVAGRRGDTVLLLASDAALPVADLVAVSDVATGVEGLRAMVLDATRVLDVASLLGRRGVVSRDDLGVFALVLDPQRTEQVDAQARSTLAPLLDYDRGHGSVLVPTLEAFLDNQGRAAETARQLNLHVNSLYYRLRRIRELGGWTLEDPEERLTLQVACRILRITGETLQTEG